MFLLKVYTTALVSLAAVGVGGFGLLYLELRALRREFREGLQSLRELVTK